MKYLFISMFMSISMLASSQVYELFEEKKHQSDLGTLNYRLMKPDANVTGKVPIVVFLHGAGERGDNNAAQLVHVMPEFAKTANRAKYPCYIIAPQCPKENWWVASDFNSNWQIDWKKESSKIQKMVMAVLNEVKQLPNADTDRIYIGGLSMGGMGTWDFIAHWPNEFAAAFPICGWGNTEYAATVKDIPIWAFHGSDDSVVPPSGSTNMVKAVQDAGGSPILTIYEGVKHNSWIYPFTENHLVFDWLFAQSK